MSEVELLEWALCENNRLIALGSYQAAPDWVQLTTPRAKTDYRNLVLRSVLSDERADERIDAARRHFAGVGVDFRWWVTPSSRPLDLAERLEARGLRLADTVVGMIADPAQFTDASPDVTLDLVDLDTLDQFADMNRRAWGGLPAARDRFREVARRELDSGGQRMSFIARYRGEPVGSGSLMFLEHAAHFAGSAVLPEFRGRGVYTGMIKRRMALVRERGIGVVTNLCRAGTSAPICEKLGFRPVCEMQVFSSRAEES
ncbi:MAG: GNAT family N-acetyltransferase [Planctomycetota bacterium]|jgi:GNAT superfamily N-acetyltransferase